MKHYRGQSFKVKLMGLFSNCQKLLPSQIKEQGFMRRFM